MIADISRDKQIVDYTTAATDSDAYTRMNTSTVSTRDY